MAVVVISQAIRDYVAQGIREIHADKIKQAHVVPTSWAERVYNTLVSADLRSKMAALPDGYFAMSRDLKVNAIHSRAALTPKGFTCVMSGAKPFPHIMNAELHGLTSQGSVHGRLTIDADDSRWDKFINEEYAPWCKGIRDVEFARDNDIKAAMAVLNSTRTLAPALKAWPALWELLPEYAKTRHKEVVDKQKRTRTVVAPVDLDILSGALAAKRMGVK